MKHRPRLIALSLVVLAACSAPPSATGEPLSTPRIDQASPTPFMPSTPPPLAINGVVGSAVSFCWVAGCADGVARHPGSLPSVAAPLELEVPEQGLIQRVTAIGPGSPSDRHTIEVPFDGTQIGEIPAGAIMLSVDVRFEPSGSATFYWHLEP